VRQERKTEGKTSKVRITEKGVTGMEGIQGTRKRVEYKMNRKQK
jgi:hypothetical protein